MEKGMHRPNLCPSAGLLITVFLMLLSGSEGGEEECIGIEGKMPILCYDCTATRDDHYCGDPFNETHPDLNVIRCKAYCVKWRRTAQTGRTYYQRTCSDKLQINMRKTVVCIEESRPSSGHLCFCDKEKCNTATSLMTSWNFKTLMILALIHALLSDGKLLSVVNL